MTTRPKTRRPKQTRKSLIRAAASEIESHGYDGTHSNKIAAKAGYAPQTFYRHFDNKLQVFVALYEEWVEDAGTILDATRGSDAAAKYVIKHHKEFLNFRRALRHLAIIEPDVRAVRAASRLKQIESIKKRAPHLAKTSSQKLLSGLLQIERLVDACAEGEFSDLGISETCAEKELADLIQNVFGAPPA